MKIFSFFLSLTLFGSISYGQAGDLDETFGEGGIVSLLSAGDSYACKVQADGKIVVAAADSDDFIVYRFNADGSPDNSFDADGKAVTTWGDYPEGGYPRDILLQADGKILVTGYYWHDGHAEPAIARYNENGSADNTFSGDGRMSITVAGGLDAFAQAAALQPDGKILIAANVNVTTYDADCVLIRVNSDGTPDNSFSDDGVAITPVSSGDYHNDGLMGVAMLSDGKILTAGYADNVVGVGRKFTLIKYLADGTPDVSFNDDGIWVSDVEGIGKEIYEIPGGKILVGAQDGLLAAKFNDDLTFDNTFGGGDGYIASADIGISFYFGGRLAVLPDGSIIRAGTQSEDFALIKFKNDGSLEPTFGTAGKVYTDVEDYDLLKGLDIQPDGKIVVTGFTEYKLITARYLSGVEVSADDIRIPELIIYPNPADNIISIQITEETKMLQFFNQQGSLVKEIPVNGNEKIITADINNMPAGAYMLKYINNNTSAVRIFIKK